MPIYLDRHDAQGVSAEDVAEAHYRDVAIQDKYGVHYHAYWFDPDQGTIFCLAEGPDKQAIENVHQEAHGMTASIVMELDNKISLNSMLGSLPVHPVGTPYVAPALRAIVFTDMSGSVAQTQQHGDEGHMERLIEHNRIVREELTAHEGREVKHTGDGIMAAFTSVSPSVAFAIAVQRRLSVWNEHSSTPFEVSIGISAGEPITDDHEDLFGAAVQLAARLCGAAQAGDIVASVAVRELCMGKRFKFEDRGTLDLKGLPQPTQSYTVSWREQVSWHPHDWTCFTPTRSIQTLFLTYPAVQRRGATLQREIDELEQNSQATDIAANKFDHVAKLLSRLDLESIQEESTIAERQVLVEDLVDLVRLNPNRLTSRYREHHQFWSCLEKPDFTLVAASQSPADSS